MVRGYTDYWFNANFQGINSRKVKEPAQRIVFGEGNDGSDFSDARYNLSALPVAWLSDEKSPAHRHLGGACYAFLDGHVKWLFPYKVVGESPAQNEFTFSPK